MSQQSSQEERDLKQQSKCNELFLEWHAFPFSSVQFSSVTHSCLTHCNPMNRSTPGLTVHHQLPGSTQTNAHCVGDVIQPPYPLLSPSPPVFNISQHQGLSNELTPCIKWPTYWSFSIRINYSNEYSGLISFSTDWFDLLAF